MPVIQGQVGPPVTYYAPNCYYMPERTPMSNVNNGNETATFYDSFAIPVGGTAYVVIETNYTGGLFRGSGHGGKKIGGGM